MINIVLYIFFTFSHSSPITLRGITIRIKRFMNRMILKTDINFLICLLGVLQTTFFIYLKNMILVVQLFTKMCTYNVCTF